MNEVDTHTGRADIIYNGDPAFFDNPHKRAEPRPVEEQMSDEAAARMAEHHQQTKTIREIFQGPVSWVEGVLAAEEFDPATQQAMREHEVAKQKKVIAQVIDSKPVVTGLVIVRRYQNIKERIQPYLDVYRSRRAEAKRIREATQQ